jgi:hypothetical protein
MISISKASNTLRSHSMCQLVGILRSQCIEYIQSLPLEHEGFLTNKSSPHIRHQDSTCHLSPPKAIITYIGCKSLPSTIIDGT